jgi:O-antigen/teichoic acid export membrane protein
MSQLKAGALLSYLLIFLNNLIKLGYTPFLIRSLGQSDFGLYSIAAATIGYLTIMDLGFGNAMIRYTAKYKNLGDERTMETLHGMFLAIYSALGLIVAITGIIFYYHVDRVFSNSMSQAEVEKMAVLILILSLNLAITLPSNLYKSIIIAHEKFVFSKLINLINVLLPPIIMVPLLLNGYKSVTMVLVMTVVNIITIGANFWYCKYKIRAKIVWGSFNKNLLKEVTIYSFFVFLNGIVDQIYWNTGQFILGAVAGTVAVAVYSIAITIKNLYFTSSSSISGLLLPKITAMANSARSMEKDISNLFIKVGRLQYIVLSFILFTYLIFGKKFIELWAGIDYSDSFEMSLWILIPVTVPLIQNTGLTILQAQNRQKFRSYSYIVIAIINLMVSIPMAKYYGGLGCAITTGVSLFIGNVLLMNWYYHKYVHLAIYEFWLQIVRLTVPFALASLLIIVLEYLFPQSFTIYTYLLEISIFLAISTVLLWTTGLDGYEKGLILDVKKKILKYKII